MKRRELVGGGLLAGLATVVAPASAADESDRHVVAAIGELRRSLEQLESLPWRNIGRVREEQRTFLRTAQKYPEFMEVGVRVWESVHDWHITFQQALTMTRLPDGRYVMTFMFTTLILRPDQSPDYVGDGFDAERPPLR
jgi:hypothetical protein